MNLFSRQLDTHEPEGLINAEQAHYRNIIRIGNPNGHSPNSVSCPKSRKATAGRFHVDFCLRNTYRGKWHPFLVANIHLLKRIFDSPPRLAHNTDDIAPDSGSSFTIPENAVFLFDVDLDDYICGQNMLSALLPSNS